MSFILETKSITKEYLKGMPVLRDASIHVEKKSIYGIIGKPGAGKSTLLKIVSGIIRPDSGEVLFPGGRPGIGTLIDLPGIYPNLTAANNLAIKLKALGCYSKDNLEALIERTGMGYWKNLKVRVFSKNMLKKLGIALAVAGDPELILLDEPFQDLEKQEAEEAKTLIRNMAATGKHTFILTAPVLESLSGLADRFGLLENGTIIREDAENGLSSHLPGHIVLRTNNIEGTKTVLDSLGIYAYQTKNAYTLHVMEQLDRSNDIIEALVSAGISVYECAVVREMTDEFYFSGGTGGDEA